MDSSFDWQTTPILDFNYYKPSRASSQKLIAFPAYAYRVLCPLPSGERLNPFQRAVLHFASIGVTEPAKMAENLQLHPDLMALVSIELQGMGLLRDTGLLTPKGLSALNDDDALSYKLQTAYVFQNVWTGILLPRVKPHLEYATIVYNEEGNRRVEQGTHGAPRRLWPFFLDAPDASYQPIDTDAILRAVQLHHRRSKANDVSYEIDENLEYDATDIISLPLDISRIQRTSESPIAVYLLTSLYFLEDAYQDGWYVGDPFGLGISPWLHQMLQARRKEDSKLNELLEDLENKHKENTPLLDDVIALEAEDTLTKIFTSEVCRHAYYKRLSQFEYRFVELKYKPSEHSGPYEDLIVQLAKITERALGDILSRSRQPIKYPNSDRSFRQQQLNQCAEKIGLTVSVPDYYTNISPNKVNSAAKKENGTIAESLIALILNAAHDNDHILRYIATVDPDFLVPMAQLAQDRNKSAHSSDQKFGMESVEIHRHHVFNFISIIMETQGNHHVETQF